MTVKRTVIEPETQRTASPLSERDQVALPEISTATGLSATLRASATAEVTLVPTATAIASETSVRVASQLTYWRSAVAITASPRSEVTATSTSILTRPTPASTSAFADDVVYADLREVALRNIAGTIGWPGRYPATPVGPPGDDMALPEPTDTADVDSAATATADGTKASVTADGADEAIAALTPAVVAEETEAVDKQSPTADATLIEKTATHAVATTTQLAATPVDRQVTMTVAVTVRRTVIEPEAQLTASATSEREQAAPQETSSTVELSASIARVCGRGRHTRAYSYSSGNRDR